MAQAKRKTATKTAAKKQVSGSRKQSVQRSQKKTSQSNVFFVAGMSFLAATLLFADLMFMMA